MEHVDRIFDVVAKHAEKKEHDDKRRVARCSGCRFLSQQEYQPYPRLWPFLTCKVCGDKVLDLAACPQNVTRRER